jgi:hypothetical protein
MSAFIDELQGADTLRLAGAVDAAAGVPFAECRLLSPIRHPVRMSSAWASIIMSIGMKPWLPTSSMTASSPSRLFHKRVNEAVDPGAPIQSHHDSRLSGL